MTGIIRKLDSAGRVSIPSGYRTRCGMDSDKILITERNGMIIIEKAKPYCKICGSDEMLNEKCDICMDCMIKIINSIS